jgi:hypothetical protein
MQTKLHWTLVALATLGGTASAEVDVDPSPVSKEAVMLSGTSGSARGVAQDYMVLPPGGELTGSMRFIMARELEGFSNDEATRFTDLALFTIGGRYSLLTRLELSASASFLAKQPSSTDEKPWQSAALGLRSPLGKQTAIAIGGSVGHLIDHKGQWTAQSITLQWRKPIEKVLTFDVSGGLEGIGLNAPKEPSAFITEVSGTASALFREPHGHWGAWTGIGYAIPVLTRGTDPTTNLALDPQPRLDFRIGTVISLNQWDLFAEFAVVDRGDLANPATRLPVLAGGFDQRQILFGVSRHINTKKSRRDHDDAYEISQR